MMKDELMLETLDNNSNMEMAAAHLSYKNKMVTAKRLCNLSCEILNNPEKHKQVISEVRRIIDELRKLDNSSNTENNQLLLAGNKSQQ